MPLPATLKTKRLILRPWRDEDREPFAAMSADPRVMAYFPKLWDRQESDAAVDRLTAHFQTHGFGIWAVELAGEVPFIGTVGLVHTRIQTHFTPCVEVGWRIAAAHWNKGYATEAAKASLRFGFEQLGLKEIVAYAAPANRASCRVIEKLGMTRNPEEDFDHPEIPEGHPSRRLVLYRMAANGFVYSDPFVEGT